MEVIKTKLGDVVADKLPLLDWYWNRQMELKTFIDSAFAKGTLNQKECLIVHSDVALNMLELLVDEIIKDRRLSAVQEILSPDIDYCFMLGAECGDTGLSDCTFCDILNVCIENDYLITGICNGEEYCILPDAQDKLTQPFPIVLLSIIMERAKETVKKRLTDLEDESDGEDQLELIANLTQIACAANLI